MHRFLFVCCLFFVPAAFGQEPDAALSSAPAPAPGPVSADPASAPQQPGGLLGMLFPSRAAPPPAATAPEGGFSDEIGEGGITYQEVFDMMQATGAGDQGQAPAIGDYDHFEPDPLVTQAPEDLVEADVVRSTFPYTDFRFDAGTPTVFCLPARVCSVELEVGEQIVGIALGDSERWQLEQLAVGHPARQVVLAFRPDAFGIRTNVLITTDRRAYVLRLEAAAYPESEVVPATLPLTERARFTYPAAWVQRPPTGAMDGFDANVAQTSGLRDEVETVAAGDPTALHFGYGLVQPRRGKRFTWRPTVWDDGTFTYVRLPAYLDALPAIRGLDESSEPFLLNETIHARAGAHATIEIPRLVNAVELFVGTGRHRRSVVIRRYGAGA